MAEYRSGHNSLPISSNGGVPGDGLFKHVLRLSLGNRLGRQSGLRGSYRLGLHKEYLLRSLHKHNRHNGSGRRLKTDKAKYVGWNKRI